MSWKYAIFYITHPFNAIFSLTCKYMKVGANLFLLIFLRINDKTSIQGTLLHQTSSSHISENLFSYCHVPDTRFYKNGSLISNQNKKK